MEEERARTLQARKEFESEKQTLMEEAEKGYLALYNDISGKAQGLIQSMREDVSAAAGGVDMLGAVTLGVVYSPLLPPSD